MPTVFHTPSSRPVSLGDGYRLYKKSTVPIVPVVNSVVLEEGEVPEKENESKRKKEPNEESGGETKKPKKDQSNKEGEGGSAANDAETSTGSEAAAVPGKSDGDEPKDGDEGVSVPAESEPSDAKQETKTSDSASEV